MGRFLAELKRHQQELLRLEKEGSPLPYALMRSADILKPLTVRLPVTTIAQLDELVKFGPWESKQEMIFKMIDSSILEFLDSAGKRVKENFHKVAEDALEEWKAEQKRLDSEKK